MESSVDTTGICPQKSLRVIPFQKFTGPLNMALDFTLAQGLTSVDDPILRFYGWDPACLSLGRHQDAALVNFEQLAKDGYELVRRPTGGSAILHDQELTYCLMVPGGQKRHHRIYSDFHQLLAAALNGLGYPVQLHEQQLHGNYLVEARKTFACFNRPAYAEIKYTQKKVVGSAQKLFPNSLLQHGSIMLTSNQEQVLDYLHLQDEAKNEQAHALRHSSIGLAEINSRKINELALSNAIIEQFADNGVKSIYFRNHTTVEISEASKNLQMFSVDHKNI